MSRFDYENINIEQVVSTLAADAGLVLPNFLKTHMVPGDIANYYIENFHEVPLPVRYQFSNLIGSI